MQNIQISSKFTSDSIFISIQFGIAGRNAAGLKIHEISKSTYFCLFERTKKTSPSKVTKFPLGSQEIQF